MKFYGEWLGLREDAEEVDEAFVQRLWFEQLYLQEMTTTTGETVRLVQPGFWNHGAGPDFLRAVLVNGGGKTEVGAVEIHCEASDWKQHGHEKDSFYDHVILHVVWKSGPRQFFAADSRNRVVRTVELASQLKVPLVEARRHYTASDLERKVGARLGRCRKELEALPLPKVTALLEDAGWYRFQRRAGLWALRAGTHGVDQALWLGLADALGFARNREAFGSLAQRLPIALLKKETPLKREALLFGLAGFLPTSLLPEEASAHSWFRSLWDEWWKLRSEWDPQSLPPRAWNLRGVRPLNRPERRLTVLALLSDKALWKRFAAAAGRGDFWELEKLMGTLTHPFWERHYTLKSRTKRKIQLVGSDRCLRFWFNVAGPLALARGDENMKNCLKEMKTSEVMHPSSVAAVRLLGGRSLGPGRRSLLVNEGLLQIYQDFCLKDLSLCQGCDFPDLVRTWKA